MNLESRVWTGTGIDVFRFWHPDYERHTDPKREKSEVTSLNFLESGVFCLKIGSDIWEMDQSQCFTTRPGLVYQSRHHEAVPTDVFLSLRFDEDLVEEVCSVAGKSQVQPVILIPNRAQYLLLRVKQQIRSALREDLEVDLLAREVLAETLIPNSRRRYSLQQISWYASRIDTARWIFETTFSSEHSLGTVAKSVGMSPYHFAHIFSELTGVPPHQYLLNVRLQAAARLLLDGADVTAICYEVGFNQLSHFSRMFSRAFGCSPSRFRTSRRHGDDSPIRNLSPNTSRY